MRRIQLTKKYHPISLLYFTRDEFVHISHGNLILLFRGGCTPPKTGEHGGGKYPKGGGGSDTTILLNRGILAATTPPVGHPSSPEEGNGVTYPASDVKMLKFIPA